VPSRGGSAWTTSRCGGAAPGECCSSTCHIDGEGTACTDDGSSCTADVCSAGVCVHTPEAPVASYSSILCRLDGLRATVVSETTDRIQTTLLRSLDRAILKTQKAATDTEPRRERSALRHATRKVTSVGYRIQSLAGRNLLPPTVAQDLLERQADILASMVDLLPSA
jgi:hypothetical protein